MELVDLKSEIFPLIFTDDLINETTEKKYYECISVSVFDHWLTEEEAAKEIILYSETLAPDKREIYAEYEKKYLNALLELYDNYKVLVFDADYSLDDPVPEYYTASRNEFKEICKRSLREIKLFKLCFPDVGVVLEGGYDLTNTVFYKKTASMSSISSIQDVFTKSGLFILPT